MSVIFWCRAVLQPCLVHICQIRESDCSVFIGYTQIFEINRECITRVCNCICISLLKLIWTIRALNRLCNLCRSIYIGICICFIINLNRRKSICYWTICILFSCRNVKRYIPFNLLSSIIICNNTSIFLYSKYSIQRLDPGSISPIGYTAPYIIGNCISNRCTGNFMVFTLNCVSNYVFVLTTVIRWYCISPGIIFTFICCNCTPRNICYINYSIAAVISDDFDSLSRIFTIFTCSGCNFICDLFSWNIISVICIQCDCIRDLICSLIHRCSLFYFGCICNIRVYRYTVHTFMIYTDCVSCIFPDHFSWCRRYLIIINLYFISNRNNLVMCHSRYFNRHNSA